MQKQKPHASGGETDYFDLIPVDLFINILSKFSVKALGQCRCVSKRWSSIIRRPNFPTKSPPTPRLLFVVSPRIFFSSLEPQNLDKSSLLVATRYSESTMYDNNICPPIHGLVCHKRKVNNYIEAIISNPFTGEYVTTPKVAIVGFVSERKCYFGFDPIEKQFKVLCMTWFVESYQVLTLGTGNLSWRKINCRIFHYPHEDNGICIKGVLYYQAIIDHTRSIACFDVRTEKYSFVNIDKDYLEPLIMIDYKDKLGVIYCDIESRAFSLWVLEDIAKEHKWSSKYYEMPEMLHPRLYYSRVFSAGMIGSGEIVLYQRGSRNHFYMFCYNLEKNTITRASVEVPGLDWVDFGKFQTFSNFVEDLKLM